MAHQVTRPRARVVHATCMHCGAQHQAGTDQRLDHLLRAHTAIDCLTRQTRARRRPVQKESTPA